MLGNQAVQLVVGVGSGALLARLLTPRDFGLFFMASTAIAFVDSFRDFGIPMAVVQRPELDQRTLSAIWRLNLKLTALVLVVMVAAAPLLAAFFREPRVTQVIIVLALALAVDGTSGVHAGLLRRELRFGVVTAIEVSCVLVGIAVAVVAALAGAGYWALALQIATRTALQGIAVTVFAGWRPQLRTASTGAERVGLREMQRYGANITGSRIVLHIGRNIDQVVVGRAGATELGIYQNAFRWSTLPVQQVTTPLLGVVVAALSRVRDRPATFREGFGVAWSGLLVLVVPAVVYTFVAADDVVLVLLGDQWRPAIIVFRILAIGALASLPALVTKWAYYAEGTAGRQLRWSLISTPIMVVAVLVGVQREEVGVALAYTSATLLLAWPAVRWCLRDSLLRARDLWAPTVRPLLAAAVAGLVVVGAVEATPWPTRPLLSVLVGAPLFAFAYVSALLATPGGRTEARAFVELARLLRPDGGGAGDTAPADAGN